MSGPYKFAVEIEGKVYRADWNLLQGGKIHVRAPGWGVKTAPCGALPCPEAARKILREIVRDWHKAQEAERKRQEREMAKLRRKNERDRHP